MKLRYYQEDAVNAVFNYFYSGKTGNPVLALPTGTGKSLIIAELLKRSLQYWPDQRFMMLTHVKELIVQNANKLKTLWPTAPLGIYSSGLGESNTALPIIFGGIASVNNNFEAFGHRDIIIVDECHLISTNESSMYQKVINGMRTVNPKLKVIGLTATAFRIGQGMITDGGLFTDIAYDVTLLSEFNKLITEGYISPLIPKRTNIELNVEQVKMQNGDYNKHDLQVAVDIDEVTYSACKELVEYGYSRNCGLIFASGIQHCEHIASAIQSLGETATFVHSKLPTKERDERIAGFKSGLYKYIVSNGILTTGFDHPPIDIIGVLRPTMSPGLWVQMLGRGGRPYSWLIENQYIPGFNYTKENCLVLDFAGNTRRLGPINDPVKPRKKGQKTGEAPIRICPACGVYNHASSRSCCSCGQEFDIRQRLFSEASTEELIKSDMPVIEIFEIDRTIYHRHCKPGSPDSIRVSYYSGLKKFEEFICFEHFGYAKKKAIAWWKQRTNDEIPNTVNEALNKISQLRTPVKIQVRTDRKYPEVLGYAY